jgi:hypothetical protein
MTCSNAVADLTMTVATTSLVGKMGKEFLKEYF